MRALVCGKKQFKIINNHRVIGRPDFPTQNLMSRQHFEVRESDGRVYVTDLKSVNGTSLHGRRIKPEVAIELKEGDEIFAGGLTFKIAEASNKIERERLFVAGGIFLVLFAVLLCGPSVAFGRAIGLSGVATAFLSLAVPLALAVFFFQKFEKSRAWSLYHYGLAVFGTTFFLNTLLVGAIDEQTDMGEIMATNKIKYFCSKTFQPEECVQQITSCPQCANRIGDLTRDEIAGRLRNYLRDPASNAAPQAKKSDKKKTKKR